MMIMMMVIKCCGTWLRLHWIFWGSIQNMSISTSKMTELNENVFPSFRITKNDEWIGIKWLVLVSEAAQRGCLAGATHASTEVKHEPKHLRRVFLTPRFTPAPGKARDRGVSSVQSSPKFNKLNCDLSYFCTDVSFWCYICERLWKLRLRYREDAVNHILQPSLLCIYSFCIIFTHRQKPRHFMFMLFYFCLCFNYARWAT